MKFRMHVDDIFEIGSKTIFTGDLIATDAPTIHGKCFLHADGKNLVEIEIKGEVHNRSPKRDLWTNEALGICLKDLSGRDVWLIAD